MSGSRGAGRLARLAAGLVATSVSDRWAIQPLDDDRVDVIPVKCGVSRGQLLEPLDERLRRQFSPVSASGVDVRLMGGIAHANGGAGPIDAAHPRWGKHPPHHLISRTQPGVSSAAG